MKKLLLITNQAEYSEHGTITPLFDNYLKEFYEVDIVFITNFKDSFQEKGNHFIVPQAYENNILEYLTRKNIDISLYHFVMVRNEKNLLKNVLDNKDKYNYKVGFRISFPYKNFAHDFENSFFPLSMVRKFLHKQKIKDRDNMINQCDLFLPISFEMKDEFYSHIDIDTFPIFTGLDPENLNEHIVSKDDITLRKQVNEHDIGLALMPRNRYFDTIILKKVLDYYTCSIPAIVTENEKNRSIFEKDEAFFCEFELDKITNKLQELIDSPSAQDAKVGNKGQKKLLSLKRNYKILAYNLSKKLDEITE
ncbi:MAG: hypothetical protein B1H07_00745 [Campylobacteraceae bacterium 4484_166]|nr:MAG: hypothetical protein B1H07_00745 [Campylobacteraceae bacterium 4484_166]